VPLEFFGGHVFLTYTENRDMAFNLLEPLLSEANRLTLLTGMKALAVVVTATLFFLRRNRAMTGELLGIALLFAGAMGNLIDRVFRGFVVDFVKLPHWPVFNVADVAILAGMLLLARKFWREGEWQAPPIRSEPPRTDL
jgi:signal peptidase II